MAEDTAMEDIEEEETDDDDDLNLIYNGSDDEENENDDEMSKLLKDPSILSKTRGAYRCRLCQHKSADRQNLSKHYKTHLPPYVEKFTCALCKKNFESNKALIEHKQEHENEGRSFICKICKVAFTEHCDWLTHEVQHLLRVLYKCRECGRYFNIRCLYEMHIHTHYAPKIPCKICNELFKSTVALHRHLEKHTTKHICCECGKICSDKKCLEYHMVSHTGVKRHQCLYCGKGFANRSQAIIHTRVHTNERPFECKDCHRKFKQSTDMNKHNCKAKEIEKKFQCDICKRNFLRKESIITHMKIHTNDRQYPCNHCSYGAITATALKYHILHLHSKTQSYSCNVTGCTYTTKYRLHVARHKKNVHKIDR